MQGEQLMIFKLNKNHQNNFQSDSEKKMKKTKDVNCEITFFFKQFDKISYFAFCYNYKETA